MPLGSKESITFVLGIEEALQFFTLKSPGVWRAVTIAKLYKSRWDFETLFRWIKQHMRIKSFFGISENAEKVQIWTAIAKYLLVAIMKKDFKLEQSLYTILQVLSVSLFEKMPILEAFSKNYLFAKDKQNCKQLSLFD